MPGCQRPSESTQQTKDKVGIVTVKDSRVKEVMRTVCITENYGVGYLIMVSLEDKQMQSTKFLLVLYK